MHYFIASAMYMDEQVPREAWMPEAACGLAVLAITN